MTPVLRRTLLVMAQSFARRACADLLVRPAQMLEKLRQLYIQFGWLNGTLYAISRLLERLGRGRLRLVRYYIVAQPVPQPPQPVCRPSPNEIVVEAGPADAHRFTCPRPPEIIAGRFAKRHRCLMSLSKDRFAGFLWLATGHYDEDEVRCRFVLSSPGQSVWDYDVHVEPAFRMGRTFARLWDSANQKLADEGVHWTLSRISAFNPQSIGSHNRLGTVRLHALNFLCLGPVQLSLMTCRPFCHIGFHGGQVPTLMLAPPDHDKPPAYPS